MNATGGARPLARTVLQAVAKAGMAGLIQSALPRGAGALG